MEGELGSLTEKVEDLSASHKVHEERCNNDDIITTNKLNSMNDKVLEIRQLVGVTALSKGLASFKLINEMKRTSIIDENGFMVPLEDQQGTEGESEKRGTMTERTKSSKKPTAPKIQGWEVRDMKRKQSLQAKSDNLTQNWKTSYHTQGLNAEKESLSEEIEGDTAMDNNVDGKDTPPSTGSDTFDDQTVERPRAARAKTRERSVSPRKRTRSPTKKLDAIKRMISTENEKNVTEVTNDRMDTSSPEN